MVEERVVLPDDDLPLDEQAARIAAMAAEWADRVAKAQLEETDRLARFAFGGDAA